MICKSLPALRSGTLSLTLHARSISKTSTPFPNITLTALRALKIALLRVERGKGPGVQVSAHQTTDTLNQSLPHREPGPGTD